MKSETIPVWLWRFSLVALLGTVFTVALLLVLALGGISNPSHIGELVVRDDLDHDTGWTLPFDTTLAGASGNIANGRYEFTLPRGEVHALVASPYQVHPPSTILIAARQIAGPADASYGLWWGEAPYGDYHVVALNGDGYLTVFQSVDGKSQAIMEWQVFPRIHPQGEINTIQVDIDDSRVLVRVNDEVAATFAWAPNRSFETGFYVETLSTGGTTADVDWLAIWQETASLP